MLPWKLSIQNTSSSSIPHAHKRMFLYIPALEQETEQWEELPHGLRGSLKLVSITFIHSMQELIKIINQAQLYPKISIQSCSILLNHNHNSIDYVASCSDMITLLLAVMIYHLRVKLSKHLSLGRNLLFRLLKNVPLTRK